MFGRMTFVSGDAGRIDDLITYVRTVVKPATDELAGNHGLGMWVNRDSGDAMVMTVWDDEATLRASEDAVLTLRDDAAGIIGGEATVERYEPTLIDATEPHQPGNIMRLMRMHCDAADLDSHLEWARTTVLPRLSTLEGYLSFVVSRNRAAGSIASMSTFTDARCAEAALLAMAPVRESMADRGLELDSLQDFEVAIVGIRAAAQSVPAQRMVDVTDRSAAVSKS
jgi:hypothetical protein